MEISHFTIYCVILFLFQLIIKVENVNDIKQIPFFFKFKTLFNVIYNNVILILIYFKYSVKNRILKGKKTLLFKFIDIMENLLHATIFPKVTKKMEKNFH